MARAIWSGFLSFGLVNVPVGVYPATRDRTVHFNQFQRGTSDRIRYKKVNERTGDEVGPDDIVRGTDLGGGEYVLVTGDELRAVAPGRSEMIEISDFVDLEEIDPIYFQRGYYLAPKGKGSERAYALLRRAMAETKRVGIATFVMREKQYLVAVRPGPEVLTLQTMYFPDEVRQPAEELDTLPGDVDFDERELDVAERLVESLTTRWEPQAYHDTYRQRVEELVESKRAGRAVITEEAPPQSNVVNLMDALQASLERARSRSAAPGGQEPVEAGAASVAAPAGGGNERTAPGAPAGRSGRSTPPAASRRGAGAGREAGAAGDGHAPATRSQLLARAAELGVEGRSKMTKEQLAGAIGRAEAPERRRSRRAS